MTDNYTKLAELDQLGIGKMIRVDVVDKRIMLANVDGTVYAVDDMCTHEDASLTMGALQGECVKCPLHGSRFDLKTGKALDEPADEALVVYPVRLDGNSILVDLG